MCAYHRSLVSSCTPRTFVTGDGAIVALWIGYGLDAVLSDYIISLSYPISNQGCGYADIPVSIFRAGLVHRFHVEQGLYIATLNQMLLISTTAKENY